MQVTAIRMLPLWRLWPLMDNLSSILMWPPSLNNMVSMPTYMLMKSAPELGVSGFQLTSLWYIWGLPLNWLNRKTITANILNTILRFTCCVFDFLPGKLPFSIRVLLESAVRTCDEFQVKKKDVTNILQWHDTQKKDVEIPFIPSRVILQDFTWVLHKLHHCTSLLKKCICRLYLPFINVDFFKPITSFSGFILYIPSSCCNVK